MLFALLLAAVPAFAESVTVHLDLSDSVREAIARGDVKNVLVAIGNRSVKTTATTAVIYNVAPGPTKLRTLLITPAEIYALDPSGTPVDVVPGGELMVPVHALFVTGTIALHGKPLRGQMEVWPSAVSRDAWGIAVPFDEQGRFAFPLPRAGQYDLQVWWKTTDADGGFTVEGLIGGTWKLSAAGQPAEAIVLDNGGRKDGVLLRVGH